MVATTKNLVVLLALVLVTAVSYYRMSSHSHESGDTMMLAAALVLGIIAALLVRILFATGEYAMSVLHPKQTLQNEPRED